MIATRFTAPSYADTSVAHVSGGVVLWSRSFTPSVQSNNPVNAVVRHAFVEERTGDDKFDRDGYTVRWTFANELELIFVVSGIWAL